MPTLEEKRIIDSSNLDTLISKLMEAVQKNDINKVERLKDEINSFKIDTFFVDLQKRAREAVDDVSFGQIEAATTELSAIAARIFSFSDAIKVATKIAEESKANLLLPMLASQSGRMLQIVSALKKASENVKGELENIQGYDEIPSAINNTMDSIKNLQSKVENFYSSA